MGRKRVTKQVKKTRPDGNGGTVEFFETVTEWVTDNSSSTFDSGYSGSSDSGSSSSSD